MRRLKRFAKAKWHDWASRSYPYAYRPIFPLSDWKVNDVGFLEGQEYNGVDWGRHLGEDYVVVPGTPVYAIDKGSVVHSALHATPYPPEAEGKQGSNWGNIIIIAHKNPRTKKAFFSVYGHLGECLVRKGEMVAQGKLIGTVAEGWTMQNGWWKISHLHFAIYTGPWIGVVLPGAHRGDANDRTRLEDWENPTAFIERYNAGLL